MDHNGIVDDLAVKGYCVIRNVLSDEEVTEALQLFYTWQLTHDDDRPRFHGIYKTNGVGHAPLAWFVRTRPRILEVFRLLWGCDDLIVSFDGCGHINADDDRVDDTFWTHTDQAPSKRGLECYQGLVALTHNRQRTLVVYEGTHQMHESYFRDRGMQDSDVDWHVLDPEFIATIQDRKRVVEIPAGSLAVWDSRLFHHSQHGCGGEERLVQYVCYFPRSHPLNTTEEQERRRECASTMCTTTHWPVPVHLAGDGPRHRPEHQSQPPPQPRSQPQLPPQSQPQPQPQPPPWWWDEEARNALI